MDVNLDGLYDLDVFDTIQTIGWTYCLALIRPQESATCLKAVRTRLFILAIVDPDVNQTVLLRTSKAKGKVLVVLFS